MGTPDDEPLLQRQARALGDPTRYQLFRIISDAGHPLTVTELVAEMGFHHTVIRQHLAVLRNAGLLVETTERSRGPGRPHLLYRTSVDAATRWAGPAPYEQLSVMVLEMLDSATPPREVGRTAGATAAERVAAAVGQRPEVAVVCELTRLGFDPRCEDAGDGLDVELRHCPMATAATKWPEIVCELHHGIVEGMAAALGAGAVREFSPAEAHRGGCRFHLACRDRPHRHPS
jgi:predicted ArsR family transcriptional regulator